MNDKEFNDFLENASFQELVYFYDLIYIPTEKVDGGYSMVPEVLGVSIAQYAELIKSKLKAGTQITEEDIDKLDDTQWVEGELIPWTTAASYDIDDVDFEIMKEEKNEKEN